MARESYIKQFLSGKWLVLETVTKNYKLIISLIVALMIMIYQQYRVDALYVKTLKLKQELKIVRTKYIYTSVELMNNTLESAVTESINKRLPGLVIPDKLPMVIELPKKQNDN